MRRFEEAKIAYDTIIALEPDNSIAHNKLGAILHDLNKLDGAAESPRTSFALT